ncbi:MAG: Abi family protein [Chitinophagaceae bacterium]|nr:Abi family protein [Chitinophagaceae bacterium]MCW5928784.1 Abi family protein [Chitinophagaceae bacterium]
MNINDLEKLLSQKRLSTYYNLFPTDKGKAIEYYRLNTQISESLYPLLSNLEITLRNSIHNSFTIHHKSDDWFSQFRQPELFDQVNVAKRKILTGHNPMTADKVIAELTFGFWTALFNKQYAKYF